MLGEFVILENGELVTYTNFDDIPEQFENLIKFVPLYPCGPHTEEEHDEMGCYDNYLKELMKRETR